MQRKKHFSKTIVFKRGLRDLTQVSTKEQLSGAKKYSYNKVIDLKCCPDS